MPVLSMTLSCPIDEPMIAGPISFAMRCTASCWRFQRGIRRTPNRSSDGIWMITCSTPPTKTPTASATTGRSKYGESHAAKTIITMLSTTDVNAGKAKRP